MRMLDAVRIRATIVSVEYEESSKRWVVSYRAAHQREGRKEIETIRTDIKDDPRGVTMSYINRLAPGVEVIVYKQMVPTGDPMKPFVRVAPYIRVLPQRQ